jgi:AcrR family transcriptional regulator
MTAMVASQSPTQPARKGRPRDERLDGEIRAAAVAVLADEGFDRFSVEEVAARARVAKTTIYRRFPCRTALIEAALDRLAEERPPDLAPGTVRERLIVVLSAIRRSTPDSPRGRILMHAMASDDPRLAYLVHERVIAPRSELLQLVIADGVASGELRADLDVDSVLPILVGPMLYLGLWRMRDGVRKVSVEDVVDLIMVGLTRASGS